MTDTLTTRRPDDWHLHLRDGDMLTGVLPHSAKDFARADALRDGFAAAGVIVKDGKDGATWELGSDFDASKLEAL